MWGKPDNKTEWGKGGSAKSSPAPAKVVEKQENVKQETKPITKSSNAPQKWGKNPESDIVVKAITKGKDIDKETFQKMKVICMNIVKGKEYYSFSNFNPAEYKYFTELVELYQKYVGKAISKEDAETAEKVLLKEYTEYKEQETKWWDGIVRWNDAIRVTEMCRSSMNKCDDKDVAFDLALQAISKMTGDVTVMSMTRKKYFGDKPLAVTYDVSSTFFLDKE